MLVPLAAEALEMARVAVPLVRVAKLSKLWSSERKATVPVGVGSPEGPATVAVSVKLWPSDGLDELVRSATVGVSLLESAMTVPPLAAEPSQLLSPA